jgi:hypothetical protein
MLYPATEGDELGDHDNVTEYGIWVPVPDREIVVGEFVALLVMTMLPVTLAVSAGENVTFIVVDPGAKICPVDTPLGAKPEPEMLTLEIVTLEFPELVSATGRTPLLPIATLPKFKLDGLELSSMVATGLTVSVAPLLVADPAELLTATLNVSPEFAVVVAAVV